MAESVDVLGGEILLNYYELLQDVYRMDDDHDNDLMEGDREQLMGLENDLK